MLENQAPQVFSIGQEGVVTLFLCRGREEWSLIQPVITALLKRGGVLPGIAASGWILTHLEHQPDVFGEGRPLQPLGPGRKLEPKVLVTAGSGPIPFLEVMARKAWPTIPMVCIESGYEACGGLFTMMQRAGAKLPEFVCCIDGFSLERLGEFNPQFGMSSRAMTTGNPEFTRVAAGGAEERECARKALELGERRLVTYLGVPGDEELVAAFAATLSKDKDDVLFALRRHPSDPADYAQSFRTHGLRCLEDAGIDTETIIAASNLVLSPGSSGIVHAALRRIPAAHIADQRYLALGVGVRSPLLARKNTAVSCMNVEAAGELVRRYLNQESGADADLAVMRRAQQEFHMRHRSGNPAEEIARHILRFLTP